MRTSQQAGHHPPALPAMPPAHLLSAFPPWLHSLLWLSYYLQACSLFMPASLSFSSGQALKAWGKRVGLACQPLPPALFPSSITGSIL